MNSENKNMVQSKLRKGKLFDAAAYVETIASLTLIFINNIRQQVIAHLYNEKRN